MAILQEDESKEETRAQQHFNCHIRAGKVRTTIGPGGGLGRSIRRRIDKRLSVVARQDALWWRVSWTTRRPRQNKGWLAVRRLGLEWRSADPTAA
jgi:hypothetical protein